MGKQRKRSVKCRWHSSRDFCVSKNVNSRNFVRYLAVFAFTKHFALQSCQHSALLELPFSGMRLLSEGEPETNFGSKAIHDDREAKNICSLCALQCCHQMWYLDR